MERLNAPRSLPPRPPPPRALGLLPLAFFAWTAVDYATSERLPELLWWCNVASLLVGVGLLARAPRLVWVGLLWTLPGLPLWLWDCALHRTVELHSVFTHFGTAAIALAASRRLPRAHGAWRWALFLGLALQLACRYATPARLNVNASHTPWAGVAGLFASYAPYWFANVVLFAVMLFALEWAVARLAPRPTT